MLHPSAVQQTTEANVDTKWQEYVPDTTKSDDENAAAKAEHDKTKPAAAEPEKSAAAAEVKLADLTLPEGLTVSDEQYSELSGVLENPDVKARTQGLLDLYAKLSKEASEKGSQAWDAMQEEWQKSVQEHPTYGGAKLQESLGSISKLIDEYSDNPAEVRAALDLTKAGNHPALFAMMAKVAATLSEGRTTPAGNPASTLSAAEKMYPTMRK